MAGCRLGLAFGGGVGCDEGSGEVMSLFSSSSLSTSPGSDPARMARSCSLATCMTVGKGAVIVVTEGGGLPPGLLGEPWVGLFWNVGAGLLLPFNSSSRSSGGGSVGFVWAA